jgi:hypothetical protein
MSEKKTLFDTLYEGCEETIKSIRKPLARKSIKRKIRSGWDDAQAKIDTANIAIEDEIAKVTNCDMQVCVENKQEIRTLKEMQQDLAELYKDLFNETFNSELE